MLEDHVKGFIRFLQALVRFRNVETGRHCEHVSRYARIAAEALNQDPDYLEAVELCASLHDIGKLPILNSVLMKPSQLTPGELALVRAHAMTGAEMMETFFRCVPMTEWKYGKMLKAVVRWHHEHVDGAGYPDGLRSKEIPIEAKIVAVADVWDVLTSCRTYKRIWTPEEALGYLWQHVGTQFDDTSVEAFTSNFSKILSEYNRFRIQASSGDRSMETLSD
jgi:two-component system response regulator RpfG